VALVAGPPRSRRQYLDVLLALTVRGYVEALHRYRRALRHRVRASAAELPSWERLLAESGAEIMRARRAWVARWALAYRQLCAALGESGESDMGCVARTDPSAEALAAALERSRPRDLALGRTTVGPHRDELRLLLEQRDLRVYGSAGQQRTAALSLRLLEAATLREAKGEAVTICLDDAFAELDETRSRNLAALVAKLAEEGSQVVAAVPKESDLPEPIVGLSKWRILDGIVQGEGGSAQ
jgi:DNA replication and repair protein RecF